MPSYDLPQSVGTVFLALCEGLASPRSLKAWLLFKYREFDQLALYAIRPSDYLQSGDYDRDNIAVCFLRKYPELPTTIDRKAVAVDNFWASERSCFRTNRFFSRLRLGLLERSDLAAQDLIDLARKNVEAILGPCPDLFEGRFGPGATYGDRGRLTTVPDKMSSQPTLTPLSLPFLFQWSGTAWASALANRGIPPAFVRGNRFTTVPKDSSKDRGICIEPSINVYYQLAVGRLIRKRLRRYGIDLDRGQDIHRRVAREASIRGHLATIDLSNASDTVSKELVRSMLPKRWFDVLSALRSPFTEINGKTVYLEKFSSMGNGYTFELETLIFLCLVQAAATLSKGESLDAILRKRLPGFYVFGDDIIVPSDVSRVCILALNVCGFTVNEAKSFTDGDFRESCGGDFFKGVDVRPYFLKFVPTEPQDYIKLANGIRRLATRHLSVPDPRFTKAWFKVLDQIPVPIRNCRGPEGLGDLLLHDESSKWFYRWRHGIRYYRCYKPVQSYLGWAHWHPDVVLASALYGVGDGERGVTPRSSVSGYRIGWVPMS